MLPAETACASCIIRASAEDAWQRGQVQDARQTALTRIIWALLDMLVIASGKLL